MVRLLSKCLLDDTVSIQQLIQFLLVLQMLFARYIEMCSCYKIEPNVHPVQYTNELNRLCSNLKIHSDRSVYYSFHNSSYTLE